MRGLPFHIAQEMAKQTRDEIFEETTRECMMKLIDHGMAHRRSELRKLDTIDVSAYGMEHCDGNYGALPRMNLLDEKQDMVKENWCLTIPPLLKGVLLINKDRYLMYEVSSIDLEAKTYELMVFDYGYDMNVWTLNSTVFVTIQNGDTIQYVNCRDATLYAFLKSIFVDTPKGVIHIPLDQRTYHNLTTVLLPALKEAEDDLEPGYISFDMLNHFITAIVHVNIELLSGAKLKAQRKSKTNTKVTTVVDKVPEKNPKPQIVRTLPSGVKIKSVKAPKGSTLEVVRHYKVASWNVRGHMRHYKNGKVTYIEPRVAHRKEFANATDVNKRQTIIVSERKG